MPASVRDRFPAPAIMGIVNVTPDSFSDGGRFLDADAAVAHGVALAAEGAHVLDIGGESTRPGSDPVSLEDELARVVPVIQRLAREVDVPISIDTMKAGVAQAAIEAGAGFVNDVTALSGDPEMAGVVAAAGVPVCLMHMRGRPKTMQDDPRYGDVVAEVREFLAGRAEHAIAAGISSSQICVDPGLGFGKTAQHNLSLIRHLDRIAELGSPVLVGPSRKRFLGAVTGAPEHLRGPASVAAAAASVRHGAWMVRVHEVAPIRDALAVEAAVEGAP
ncbi:MAG: dihydropteroate synthase [Gaiellales bacterium]